MNGLIWKCCRHLFCQRWLDAFEEHASYCTRHDTEEVIIDDAAGDVRVRNLEQALQVRPGSKSKVMMIRWFISLLYRVQKVDSFHIDVAFSKITLTCEL